MVIGRFNGVYIQGQTDHTFSKHSVQLTIQKQIEKYLEEEVL